MLKFLKYIIGKFLVFLDNLISPTPVIIDARQKKIIETRIQGLELYQFYTCPFCIKVRRYMKRNNILIPFRDAKNDKTFRQELLEGGGKILVPCLKISKNNQVKWLYESNDIISYFSKEVLD